jgi:hypothetical protein
MDVCNTLCRLWLLCHYPFLCCDAAITRFIVVRCEQEVFSCSTPPATRCGAMLKDTAHATGRTY